MKEPIKINSLVLIIVAMLFRQVLMACTRERCCLISTCTSLYCQQQSSETWISTQLYSKYQYTKLIMVNNQCKPCAYDCKTCSSQTTCQECYDSFYMDSSTNCQACPYKCLKCQIINNIQKCSQCDDGTYLDLDSKTCKICPMGAKTCSDSTNIIQCNLGYLKSSNSLFCTPCTANCLTCPNTNSVCTVCATGYYVSSGACRVCGVVGCSVCLASGANVLCSSCQDGYYRSSTTTCTTCSSNCRICTSATVCTACSQNYFIQAGSCASVPTQIPNCYTYSNTTINSINKCTACLSGYYLSSTSLECIPCSITCTACYGDHFGRCTACVGGAKLFNQMCLPYAYADSRKSQLYFTAVNDVGFGLSGGVQTCNNLLYSGTSISIKLNSISSYKITLTYRIFTATPSQSYSITLSTTSNSTTSLSTSNTTLTTNTTSITLLSTSQNYTVCSPLSPLYTHINSLNLSYVKINNTITFASALNLYFAELLVVAYRCADLCLECSQVQCFQCFDKNLYRQDAYCVYACSTGYYTYQANMQCVKECPIGTYGLLTNISCMACVSPCFTCLNDKYCLSCQTGFFLSLQDHTCITVCPYRYYGSVKTQKCEQCVGRCLQCIDDSTCLSCQVGFLENGTCVDNCQPGFYQNIKTLKCQACSINCLTCQYNINNCISCNTTLGLYLYNGTCVTVCPNGYYKNLITGVCSICVYPCQKCTGTPNTCLSCVDGYLLNSACYPACPNLYYEDNVQLLCVACALQCTKCVGAANYCTQCATGYKLFNNLCLTACPSTYYPQTLPTSLIICSKCTGLCYTCTSSIICTSCVSNFLVSNGTGICVQASKCLFGEYADINTLKCLSCSASCQACLYLSNFCVVCPVNFVLYNGACLSACPSNYFYNLTTVLTSPVISSSVCTVCESPCLTCGNKVQCFSCVTGYKYSSNTNLCSSTCSIGTFFNVTINDCQQCSTSCLTCQSSTFCYACQTSKYLYVLSTTSNQCLASCPATYYVDGRTCMKCLYPCNLCTSTLDCVTCVNGILYQSRCISGCPDSTFMQGTALGNVCVDCGGLCITCKNSATNCTSCKTGYYLVAALYQCVLTCPDGTYSLEITKSCMPCPDTCSKCLNSSYCTACKSGKTYLIVSSHSCVEYCPSGSYANTLTIACQTCVTKCQTCSGTASQCLTCSPGYLLTRLLSSTFDCVTSCPSQYYSDSAMCYPCQFPCKQCISASKCVTCAVGTFLHEPSQSCLLACPLGTYYELTPIPKCKNCISPCQNCKSNTSCISCIPSYLLSSGTCVLKCPDLYYADGSGICNRCFGVCKTCSGKYQCLTCQTGYAYNGYCYSACPPGTFASEISKKCQPCISPCLECTGTSSYCKRCQSNKFAYKGACSSSCPVGTYQSGQICQICQFPCIKCSNQFTCEQCIGGYLLYMRTSCIINQPKCPNDLYKLNSKECVPSTWCPAQYYHDEELKTCSTTCSREKYVNMSSRACLDKCGSGEWVGVDLRCMKWGVDVPLSLMAMDAIVFIRCSQIHVVIILNETYQWLQKNDKIYTIRTDSRRRLLSKSSSISYSLPNPQQLVLQIKQMPYSSKLTLPAYYLRSTITNYNPQTTQITIKFPKFIPYSYEQVYIGSIMRQFGEGISWFIILFSMFFLVMNRVSDAYVLWDTAQLLYLIVFLDLQLPPNLNDFLVGLANINFLFFPTLFDGIVGKKRLKSSSSFYAYSYDSSFLRTAGFPLVLVLVIMGIFLILKIIQAISQRSESLKQKLDQNPKVKAFIGNGLMRFRWHHTSDTIFLTYNIIALFSIVEISNISKNPNNIASNVIAVIMLLIYLAFPCFVSWKLYRHFGNISKGKMVTNLQCFYRGIEKTNKFGISLILLRYFRKILYAIIIGVFTDEAMFALPILTFTSVLFGLFIFINKPFKKKLSNIVNVGVEISLVLVFLLIAGCKFGEDLLDVRGKMILGWTACGFLLLSLFALIFQIFCKTMFYLEPEGQASKDAKQGPLNDLTKKFSDEYIRQKAGQFFDHIFPRLKLNLNENDSEDGLKDYEYEEGDSENSQNNDQREKNWGINRSETQSKHSDEFRHYGDSDASSSKGTGQMQQNEKKAPNYLIRCIKELN